MLNVVIIAGKMLKDVETMKTGDGSTILTFTIINTRDVRDRQTGERGSDFFDVVAWNDLAVFIADNFKKGDRITIVGRLQRRMYTTSDGERRKQVEIVAEKAYFSGEGLGDINLFER